MTTTLSLKLTKFIILMGMTLYLINKSSVVVITSLLPPPTELPTNVTTICKKTPYFDTCMSILFPDPRTSQIDTKGIAKIVMEKDLSISKEILPELQSLVHDKHKHPLIREKCGVCAKEYKEIVFTIFPDAFTYLGDGKYGATIRELSLVARHAKACDDEFSKGNLTEPFVNMSVHDIALIAVGILKTIN